MIDRPEPTAVPTGTGGTILALLVLLVEVTAEVGGATAGAKLEVVLVGGWIGAGGAGC